MSDEWVVDANVGIKLFIAEELSPAAELLFGRLREDPPVRLYVPDLFYLECTNILWKHVRRFAYPMEDAREDLVALRRLALDLIASAELVSASLDLAMAQSISAYDACYAALSTWLGVPLVTADERLIRKLDGSGVSVRWLGDL